MFDGIEIPYMIIGGQATLLYGEPRLTLDIDLTLGVGPERLSDVLRGIQNEGWQVLVEDTESFVRDTLVLPCLDTESNIRIDCIFSFSPYESEAIARAVEIDIDGTMVKYASPEDLVIHKIVAGRPRDLEDVRGVLLKRENIDEVYITNWLSRFDESLEEAFTGRFRDIYDSINRDT